MSSPPTSTLFPYTTLFRSPFSREYFIGVFTERGLQPNVQYRSSSYETVRAMVAQDHGYSLLHQRPATDSTYAGDRKSTRLNSSHGYNSYAVFCWKTNTQSD